MYLVLLFKSLSKKMFQLLIGRNLFLFGFVLILVCLLEREVHRKVVVHAFPIYDSNVIGRGISITTTTTTTIQTTRTTTTNNEMDSSMRRSRLGGIAAGNAIPYFETECGFVFSSIERNTYLNTFGINM